MRLYLQTARTDQCGIVELTRGQQFVCGFCGTIYSLIREPWPEEIAGPVTVRANYQMLPNGQGGEMPVCGSCLLWILKQNMATAPVGSVLAGMLYLTHDSPHGDGQFNLGGFLGTWLEVGFVGGVVGKVFPDGSVDGILTSSELGVWAVKRPAAPSSFPVTCTKQAVATSPFTEGRPARYERSSAPR